MMKSNQTLFQKGITFMLIGTASLVLTGCGTNVFETLESGDAFSFDSPQETTRSLRKQLDNTRSSGKFAEIRETVQDVIDDQEAPTESKQAAQVIKGEAILGENELSLLNLASSVFELIDEDEGNIGFSTSTVHRLNNEEDPENIFEIMRDVIENTPTDDLIEAANAFNYAHDFFEANSVFTLPKKVQLIRGVANALVTIKQLTGYFIIDESTGITFRSNYDADDVVVIMDALFDFNGDNDTTDRITLYATEMQDGFTRANLPDDMSQELDRIKLMADDFNTLYAAMQQADGVYRTRLVGTNAGGDRNDNIADGISDIVTDHLGRD